MRSTIEDPVENEYIGSYKDPSTSKKAELYRAQDALLKSDLLIRIGSAELDTTLPTNSDANRRVYRLIREKEEELAEIRAKVNSTCAENQTKRQNIEKLKNEFTFLKSLIDSQSQHLDDEDEQLKQGEVELSRIRSEEDAIRRHADATCKRVDEFRAVIIKQSQLLESLNAKADDRTRRKEVINRRLDESQFIQDNLTEAFKRDSKTIKELENYVKKLTKQIYERQREVDLLKLGQLDAKAEAEGIRRIIRQIDRRHSQMQSAYNAKSGANLHNENKQIEAQKTITKLESSIDTNLKKIECIQNENKDLRNVWVSVLQEELKERLEMAKIDAENELAKRRIDRLKANIKLMKCELMYTTQQKASDGTAQNSPKLGEDHTQMETLFARMMDDEQKNTIEIHTLQSKLQIFKKEFEVNVEKIQKGVEFVRGERVLHEFVKNYTNSPNSYSNPPSPNTPLSDYTSTVVNVIISEKSVTTRRTQSVGDPKIKAHSNGQENQENELMREINHRRNGIFDECTKEVLADLRRRKTNLRAEVGLLNGEVKESCRELESLRTAIQRETDKTGEIRERIAVIKQNIVQRKAEYEAKHAKQRDLTQVEAQQMEKKLSDLSVSIRRLEASRNRLNAELIEAKVHENNLRNRFATYESIKYSAQSGSQELKRLRNLTKEWHDKVETTRAEVENLENFLRLTRERSWPTRRKLAKIRNAPPPFLTH